MSSNMKFDKSVDLADNAMLKARPELFHEWDFEKNDKLGLDIYKVSYGSNKEAWWICENGHIKQKSIKLYCKSVLGCRECTKSKFRLGVNDLWTSTPEVAKLLLNPEDGYRIFKSSYEKVDWKCVCGEVIREKSVMSVAFGGLKCPLCSDGFSFPEKVIYHVLKTCNIDFICEKVFSWSSNRRYDFYLPCHKTIIEVHGIQHYEQRPVGFAFDLKEIQKTDKLKIEMAEENGIKNYIVIDARNSEINFIRNSIECSFLTQMFNLENIDFSEIAKKAASSLHVEILKLWDEDLSVGEISDRVSISKQTVTNTLKKFEKQGLCKYDGMRHMGLNAITEGKLIIQTDEHGTIIETFTSYDDIVKKFGFDKYYINQVCLGNKETYRGFHWKLIDKDTYKNNNIERNE